MEQLAQEPWKLTRFVGWVAQMPMWSVLALLGVLVVLIVLVSILLFRRKPGEPKPVAPHRKKKASREPLGVMRTARAFHSRLREQFSGAKGIYRLPLFVVVGPSREAMAGAVQRAGLRQPLGPPMESGGLRWSAFDRAATLEIEPRMIFGGEGRGERWKQCLRILERLRPQRPVDGVIVVLPVHRLTGAEAGDADSLRGEAEELRDALAQLQNRLGMTTPVHVLLADAQALPGFDELTRILPPSRLEHPVGITFGQGANDVYRQDSIDEAIDHLVGRTEALVAEGLSAKGPPVGGMGVGGMGVGGGSEDRDDFFLLPSALQALSGPLGVYFDTLFRPGVYARMASLRGIYLSGASYSVVAELDMAFAGGALGGRIFPEASLAQPGNTSWVSQNRDVRRLQAATAVAGVAAVLALFASDRILTNRVPQVESLAGAVAQDHRRIQLAQSNGDDGGALLRENSVEFLRRMAGLEGGYLRSLVIPSSWFSQVPRDVERLQAAAYVEILFKSITASLRSRAQSVTLPVESTRALAGEASGRSVEASLRRPYPDYRPLEAMVSSYAELERQLEHYARLQQGHQDAFALRALVRYLYGLEFPENFFPDIRHESLAGRRGVLLEPLHIADFEQQGRASFLRRYDRFLDDLAARDSVAAKLASVGDLLSMRPGRFNEDRGQLSRLRGLYRDLRDLEMLFGEGRYDWVAARGAPLDSDFEQLVARVRDLPLLGERAADRMTTMAVQRRGDLRDRLTGLSVDRLGPLAVAVENRMVLSPEAEAILAQLGRFDSLANGQGGLIGRNLSGPGSAVGNAAGGSGQSAEFPSPPPSGRYLRWRLDVLENGQRVLRDFEARVAGNGAAPAVNRILDAVVRRELRESIEAIVRRAMAVRPEQTSMTRFADETALEDRVANFSAAVGVLDDFLFRLEELGADRERRALIRLLGVEAEKILAAADELLALSDLYTPDRERLADWDGGAGLAESLFGARGTAGLVTYAGEQRNRASRLYEDFAAPALGFLYQHASSYRPRDFDTLLRWQAMLEDLRAYRNAKPGNPIARLEDYIVERMQGVRSGRCALAEPQSPPRGQTFHEQRLREISRAVMNACLGVETRNARVAYSQLADRFNSDLAGRAPFVAPDEAHRAQAASPAAVIGFIETFERAMNRGIGDPRYWPDEGPLARVPQFLDTLDRAVAALRPAIDRSGDRPTLAYDVSATFRVNRDQELGGEGIIGWSLASGSAERTLFDSGRSLRWELGQPTRVSLRWASNALSEPDSADIAGYSVGDRTARFTYADPWSLFALIAQRSLRGSPSDGHLLSFDVPVSYTASEPDSARLQGGHSRVFITLRLQANGESVALPAFPVRAPKFGSGDSLAQGEALP